MQGREVEHRRCRGSRHSNVVRCSGLAGASLEEELSGDAGSCGHDVCGFAAAADTSINTRYDYFGDESTVIFRVGQMWCVVSCVIPDLPVCGATRTSYC